ncbi:hypothetical protein BGW36DRAFT_367605 [Talaromyces proteolyticus]|uniref:Pyridoxamine 5'-phosphate oxidase Alr4036 family FMN-binding domain-containing protein n=1 Tax=Talaromyces proteolyticus TaxID=1131652 RepID=A0AAD4L0R5_9EURO|nr:uncharacterized protein BGW36DRAFT_367605 [Talaromyces proteolyticus]KAH8705453.1 hypothetical protein BGW36DRAFT_367605 [Talaromyces proteolyticus]
MASHSTVPTALWKSLFLQHASKQEDPYMAVATVERDSQNGSSIPRVRYCGFRGFFGELKLHPSAEKQLRDENELNPLEFESDMLAFTTDTRMQKIEQFNEFDGAIEVVFWVKEVMTQWRLRGTAFVIGDDAKKSVEQTARAEIIKGLRKRPSQASTVSEWTWEKEITAYFANHSPVMRGSFKNPAPGRPLSEEPTDPNLKLGQKVTDLHDATARENFRVVVIRVHEVDRLDLTRPERASRWRTTLTDASDGVGQWEEVELWP